MTDPISGNPIPKETIAARVLDWYDKHARTLPWRMPPAATLQGRRQDPYKVWLAEIMLQQTTVATVTPRFLRFVKRWPTIKALAGAPRSEVLHEWAGLGYYARARNLHLCAQTIVKEYGGRFPDTASALKKLPGIGDYTAAAVAAIAFDEAATVMDGNIERVMARLHGEKTPLPAAKPLLKERAQYHTPPVRTGDYAQALMDIGAVICTPRVPACEKCPIAEDCQAHEAGIEDTLPQKAAKKKKPVRHGAVYLIRNEEAHIFLIRRPEQGLLGGMMALPSSAWTEKRVKISKPFTGQWRKRPRLVRHTFTHFHLHLTVWETVAEKVPLEGKFFANPEDAGLPTVFRKALVC